MALSIVVLKVVEITSRSVTEDVDFRSIDKLLYFVLSLLSLKLKEKRRFTWKIPGIRVPNY